MADSDVARLVENLEESLAVAKQKASDERANHLAWCKQRALEYVDQGNLIDAVASMASDLTKHPSTARSSAPELMMIGLMDANKGDSRAVRRFIEGFN